MEYTTQGEDEVPMVALSNDGSQSWTDEDFNMVFAAWNSQGRDGVHVVPSSHRPD